MWLPTAPSATPSRLPPCPPRARCASSRRPAAAPHSASLAAGGWAVAGARGTAERAREAGRRREPVARGSAGHNGGGASESPWPVVRRSCGGGRER
jgi:hypothetical protein